ncbi:MAG: metalloregulator ArsR/SmtB family transcription factor [Candidatus Paceibacterota bacterium]|jgi:DNA-binding transcriptional ArsR family regulator
MNNLEKILKAVANKRRIAIIKYLALNKEASVSDISTIIKLSFKATSKHLGVLYAADIVEKEQRSLQMFYRLASTHPVIKYISDSRE